MIITGEASGDLYGAHLVNVLKNSLKKIDIIGVGGERMKKAGADIKFNISNLATIGLVEALGKIPSFFKVYYQIKTYIEKNKPDILVLIDFPELNMKLMKVGKKLNVPVLYYFPPAVWAWRKARAKQIAKYVDKVICVFPFEAQVYKEASANVEYVGHPILDIINNAKLNLDKEKTYEKFNLDKKGIIIGLFPGSRHIEIKKFLPIMLRAAELITRTFKDAQFILSIAPNLSYQFDKFYNLSNLKIKIIKSDIYEALNICNLSIITSGTATLEAACLLAPMIVIYKLSVISWILANLLIKVRFISLPNIIANKPIVSELLQMQANPHKIAQEAISILKDERKIKEIKAHLQEVINILKKDSISSNKLVKIFKEYL